MSVAEAPAHPLTAMTVAGVARGPSNQADISRLFDKSSLSLIKRLRATHPSIYSLEFTWGYFIMGCALAQYN